MKTPQQLSQVKQLILDLLWSMEWVEGATIFKAVGQTYYDRRIRELREVGWQIQSSGTKYRLVSHERIEVNSGKPLRIFLCHSSADKPKVRELFHRLRMARFDPWLDEEDLLPGQDWQLEIPKAVQSSDIVLVCLSKESVNKAGYVQKEIRLALDVADQQPEGAIFLIPVRLENCDVPQRLSRWQWVDYFRENGYQQLLKSLKSRAQTIGKTTPL